MKVAVSIPEEVFKEAERLARRLKRSRSRLYSQALAEYLARHSSNQVTDSWNETVSEVGDAADSFTRATSRRSLKRVEW